MPGQIFGWPNRPNWFRRPCIYNLNGDIGIVTKAQTQDSIKFTRDKNFFSKNDRNVGMIEKSTETRRHLEWNNIWNSIPIPTFHMVASLWNVGMGIEFQILFHFE